MAKLLYVGLSPLEHEDIARLLTQEQVFGSFAFFLCLGFDDNGIQVGFLNIL